MGQGHHTVFVVKLRVPLDRWDCRCEHRFRPRPGASGTQVGAGQGTGAIVGPSVALQGHLVCLQQPSQAEKGKNKVNV